MVKSATGGSLSSRKADGRPDWMRRAGLFPSARARQLSARVFPEILKLIARSEAFRNHELVRAGVSAISGTEHSEANPALDHVRKVILEVADGLLREADYNELPTAKAYRKDYDSIKAAANDLLLALRVPPMPSKKARSKGQDQASGTGAPQSDPLWALVAYAERNIGLPLLERHRRATVERQPSSFENALLNLIEGCRLSSDLKAPRGPRVQPELVKAVQKLARLWTELSGKKFPKSLGEISPSADIPGAKPEFDSRGPHFVCEVLELFGLGFKFAQVRTALKSLAIPKKRRKMRTLTPPNSE